MKGKFKALLGVIFIRIDTNKTEMIIENLMLVNS